MTKRKKEKEKKKAYLPPQKKEKMGQQESRLHHHETVGANSSNNSNNNNGQAPTPHGNGGLSRFWVGRFTMSSDSESTSSDEYSSSLDDEEGLEEQMARHRRRRAQRSERAGRRQQRDGSYPGAFGGDRILEAMSLAPLTAPLPQPINRTVARPPQVFSTTSVRSDVSINKDSLRLVPLEGGAVGVGGVGVEDVLMVDTKGKQTDTPPHTHYQIRFTFDTDVACRIQLFFVAEERRDDHGRLIGYHSRYGTKTEVPPLVFAPGRGQEYVQPASQPLDTSLLKEEDVQYNPKTFSIPIVVIIEPIAPKQRKVTSQTVFATLLKCADSTYAAKPVKVKIEYFRSTYILYDIFSLDGGEDCGCVICMAEGRDTIVLPCRHMCLCRGCAEVLRYQSTKCPICRSPFESLLKIEPERINSKKQKLASSASTEMVDVPLDVEGESESIYNTSNNTTTTTSGTDTTGTNNTNNSSNNNTPMRGRKKRTAQEKEKEREDGRHGDETERLLRGPADSSARYDDSDDAAEQEEEEAPPEPRPRPVAVAAVTEDRSRDTRGRHTEKGEGDRSVPLLAARP
eukprot:TRINITY_DN2660_c0_g2_i1.p1 TRINITY_DN2660_c0_g2~~TRINITY_DN2660_c0_g2_i1.p1  ORF type:complete len:569 (+),score=120.93 TRINITY_DN2660_c0_g2_i1:77-1783(+)